MLDNAMADELEGVGLLSDASAMHVDEEVQIFVRDLAGNTLTMMVAVQLDTVGELKGRLSEKVGVARSGVGSKPRKAGMGVSSSTGYPWPPPLASGGAREGTWGG